VGDLVSVGLSLDDQLIVRLSDIERVFENDLEAEIVVELVMLIERERVQTPSV
jgi:hypothetical protein